MTKAGLDRFWKRAAPVVSALFPGEIRIYGPDESARFAIGADGGVAVGGHKRGDQFRPGGVGETLQIVARVEKTVWPEGEAMPPEGSLIEVKSVELFPNQADNWGRCRLVSIGGYQAGEPVWNFELAGVRT